MIKVSGCSVPFADRLRWANWEWTPVKPSGLQLIGALSFVKHAALNPMKYGPHMDELFFGQLSHLLRTK